MSQAQATEFQPGRESLRLCQKIKKGRNWQFVFRHIKFDRPTRQLSELEMYTEEVSTCGQYLKSSLCKIPKGVRVDPEEKQATSCT